MIGIEFLFQIDAFIVLPLPFRTKSILKDLQSITSFMVTTGVPCLRLTDREKVPYVIQHPAKGPSLMKCGVFSPVLRLKGVFGRHIGSVVVLSKKRTLVNTSREVAVLQNFLQGFCSVQVPRCSMYGIFTYIYHKFKPFM